MCERGGGRGGGLSGWVGVRVLVCVGVCEREYMRVCVYVMSAGFCDVFVCVCESEGVSVCIPLTPTPLSQFINVRVRRFSSAVVSVDNIRV